jgi:aldehyde dehydrogenase (NAD(P)+)
MKPDAGANAANQHRDQAEASMPVAVQSAEIDTVLDEPRRGEAVWAEIGLAGRRELLDRIHAATAEKAEDWVRAAAAYKRLPADSPLIGEEWITGPYPVLTSLAALAATTRALEDGRSPVDSAAIRTVSGGRVAVRVHPASIWDRLLLNGFSAEVWMPPGVSAAAVRNQAGLALKRPRETRGIGVVLGAGNITSIPILDVLYELYAQNRVVALKLNPVMDGLLDVFTDVMAPLIDIGVLRILTGGADVGTYLVRHPEVAHVHMTGSQATHDAIVFGSGADGVARKQAGRPLLDKPVTSELGGVSPVIVVPGNWSDADLRFQAEHVVTQRLHYGGYNCCASQVVIVSADWPQKSRFLTYLRAVLAEAPARVAFYPGSDDRVASAEACYLTAERIGSRLLLPDVDPHEPGGRGDRVFCTRAGRARAVGRSWGILGRSCASCKRAIRRNTRGQSDRAPPHRQGAWPDARRRHRRIALWHCRSERLDGRRIPHSDG